MPIIPKMVGSRIKRREDPRLITGHATYTDDLQLPGMVYMSVLRSIYAHAKITSIEVSKAKALSGVLTVLTGADIAGQTGSVPCCVDVQGMKLPRHPVLAESAVRYVGEPVAVVVATSRSVARDALDFIDVDYDPLDAVVDVEQAAEPSSVLLHEEFGDNIAFRVEVPDPAVDQALKEADVVVKLRIVQQRLIPMAMEPRATVAQWDRGMKQLTVWSSTQMPHILRTHLADILRLPENRVRVIAPEVGGGFGAKVNIYREEILVPYLSMQLGKPIKWTQERREDFASTIHGRGQVQYIEAAAKRDGAVTAIKAKLFIDVGAYFQFFTPLIPGFTGLLMNGAYKVPAVAFEQIAVFIVCPTMITT